MSAATAFSLAALLLLAAGVLMFASEPPIGPALAAFGGASTAGALGVAAGRHRVGLVILNGILAVVGLLALLFTLALMNAP